MTDICCGIKENGHGCRVRLRDDRPTYCYRKFEAGDAAKIPTEWKFHSRACMKRWVNIYL